MQPAQPSLQELLASLGVSADPLDLAYADNYLFEERVADLRQRSYEEELRLPAPDLRAWKDRHKSYLSRKVYLRPGETPETFQPINAAARLAGLDEEQWLVRLERLDQPLLQIGSSLEAVKAQLTLWREAEDARAATRAELFLHHLCEVWNTTVRRDHRPSFAAFYDEVRDDLEGPRWADRLRNRLGLSHYDVPEDGPAIAVALMRYRAREAATGSESAIFSVPTVLDSELNTHFFPAPREAAYGRALDLEPDVDCKRLVAEVLHRRIDYTPAHFYKVGWVTEPLPPFTRGAPFARLRNGHLVCLRRASGREDFGREIPEDE